MPHPAVSRHIVEPLPDEDEEQTPIPQPSRPLIVPVPRHEADPPPTLTRPLGRLSSVPALHEPAIPEPSPQFLRALAVQAHEAIEGRRPLLQLGPWVTRDLAHRLAALRALREERRRVFRDTRLRAAPHPGNVYLSRVRPDAAESTVLLHWSERTLAVAIRIEYLRNRWRATELAVLG